MLYRRTEMSAELPAETYKVQAAVEASGVLLPPLRKLVMEYWDDPPATKFAFKILSMWNQSRVLYPCIDTKCSVENSPVVCAHDLQCYAMEF